MTIIKNKNCPKESTWKISKSLSRRKRKRAKKGPRKISKFLTEKEKEKKRQDHCERNENLSEEKSRT